MPPDRVLLFIIGTVVILFAAYYVTYYIGMKASGQTRAGLRNRNIALLDRYAISRDKSFCVVEVAGKVYIVGITSNSMTLLDTHDAKEFARLTENSGNNSQIPWSKTPVGQYGNKLTRKVAHFFASRAGRLPKDDGSTDDVWHKDRTGFADTLREAERNADRRENESGDSEKDD